MTSHELLGTEAKSFIEWYENFKTEEGISLLNKHSNKRGISLDEILVWMTGKAHSFISQPITKERNEFEID